MAKVNPLILKGINDGKFAFCAPKVVQLDLTGVCNNHCIGCWVHSPLIKNPPDDKNVVLPFEKIKEFIDDMSSVGGLEEIFLSGAGEPFMHPQIMEIIALIKSKDIRLNIISNFLLIDESRARQIVEAGVDMLTASVWAATPDAYIKTHPYKTKNDFYLVKENISRLNALKAKNNSVTPIIKIYNVICNLNYREIGAMVDFALDTQSELVEFQVMDIIKDATSSLALSEKQIKDIKRQFDALVNRQDLYFKDVEQFNQKAARLSELKEFPGRFIRTPAGFSLKEWMESQMGVKNVTCRALSCSQDVRTIVSKKNPLVDEKTHRITFNYLKEQCNKCSDFQKGCLVDTDCRIRFPYLTILGFGSFMRRVSSTDVSQQLYEKDIIDNLPCYIGWSYARILSTGEVIPCCKARYKILGNINEKRFVDLWNADAYQQFRQFAKTLPKSDAYFQEINCYKACDNIGMNLSMQEAVTANVSGVGMLTRLPEARVRVIIEAPTFARGNVNMHASEFGDGMVVSGSDDFNTAEYSFTLPEAGTYELWSFYASGESRPVELHIDNALVNWEAMNRVTNGWTSEDVSWFREGILVLSAGEHILKVYTKGYIPHIHSFALLKDVVAEKGMAKDIYDSTPRERTNEPAGLSESETTVRFQTELPKAKTELRVAAAAFSSGNLNNFSFQFGEGIVVDGGKGFDFAEYTVALEEGTYELWSCYAAETARPVELYFDGNPITNEALNFVTGGWTIEEARWFKEAQLDVSAGEHVLKIYTKGVIPHLHGFAFLKEIQG